MTMVRHADNDTATFAHANTLKALMRSMTMRNRKGTGSWRTESVRGPLLALNYDSNSCLSIPGELESLLRDMSMELQASNAALDKTRPPSMVSSDSTRNGSQYSSPHTPADSPYTSQPTPPSDTSSQRNSHSPEVKASDVCMIGD